MLESLGSKTMFLEDPCKKKKMPKLLSVRASVNEKNKLELERTTIIIAAKGCCDAASTIARNIESCPPDSDEKTLRIATLKARFAGTILKAEKTLLEARGGGGGDVASELQRLERQKLRQNARSEAKRKANLQLERQRQREALEQMERTVILEDNLKWLKDLERSCYSSSGHLYFDVRCGKPLEQLGLYLREESPFEEYDEEELEDGEIPQ